MSSFDASIYPPSGAGRVPLNETSMDSALQPETVMPIQFYGSPSGRRADGSREASHVCDFGGCSAVL
jgi:hypothetical protein